MPDKYIKEINKMIRYFVWKGKSKISCTTMYKSKEYGGLRMPDFQTMLKVSQVKWMNRLLLNKDGSCWENLKECMLLSGIENLELLLEANYDIKRLGSSFIPLFYRKALNTWYENIDTENSRDNVIWYNKKVTVDKGMIYYRDFYKAGLIYLSDLFEESGRLVPYERWVKKGLREGSWLRWHSMITSVMKSGIVRKPVCEKDTVTGTFHIGQRKLSKTKSRQLYDHLLSKKCDLQTVVTPSIAQYIEVNETCRLSSLYNRIYKCTESTKLQEFQFKFLHNIHVNNYWLKKWKIIDTDKCTLCLEHAETLDHLIWKCKYVVNFWKELITIMNVKFNKNITHQEVYYGSEENLLSMLMIIAKQYVYNSNRKCVKPVFKEYLNKVMYIKKIEQTMYKNNNKLEVWYERWKPL